MKGRSNPTLVLAGGPSKHFPQPSQRPIGHLGGTAVDNLIDKFNHIRSPDFDNGLSLPCARHTIACPNELFGILRVRLEAQDACGLPPRTLTRMTSGIALQETLGKVLNGRRRRPRAVAGRFLFDAGVTTFANGGDRVTCEFAGIYQIDLRKCTDSVLSRLAV